MQSKKFMVIYIYILWPFVRLSSNSSDGVGMLQSSLIGTGDLFGWFHSGNLQEGS